MFRQNMMSEKKNVICIWKGRLFACEPFYVLKWTGVLWNCLYLGRVQKLMAKEALNNPETNKDAAIAKLLLGQVHQSSVWKRVEAFAESDASFLNSF